MVLTHTCTAGLNGSMRLSRRQYKRQYASEGGRAALARRQESLEEEGTEGAAARAAGA